MRLKSLLPLVVFLVAFVIQACSVHPICPAYADKEKPAEQVDNT